MGKALAPLCAWGTGYTSDIEAIVAHRKARGRRHAASAAIGMIADMARTLSNKRDWTQKRTFGSQGCVQSENDLVSVQEHDIGPAQNLRDHVPRLWFGGKRWPGLQLPLLATWVGPLPVLTNPLNAFSSALN